MKIRVFIQARRGSTRFPNKVHAALGDLTIIGWVIKAAVAIKGVSSVHVLWPEDFEGVNEEDVLGRFAAALQLHPCDAIIRLTADCPLLDPAASSLVVKAFTQESGISYASNIFPRRTWPDGLDTEVISAGMLQLANKMATSAHDREHVTSFIQRYVKHRNTYAKVELPVDWSSVRLTVDTPEDLAWLQVAIRSPRSGLQGLVKSPPAVLKH